MINQTKEETLKEPTITTKCEVGQNKSISTQLDAEAEANDSDSDEEPSEESIAKNLYAKWKEVLVMNSKLNKELNTVKTQKLELELQVTTLEAKLIHEQQELAVT